MSFQILADRLFEADILAVAIDISIKVTILLGGAAVVTRLMRRNSSALRHCVWSLALGGSLAIPAASALIPEWQIPILPSTEKDQPDESSQVVATTSRDAIASTYFINTNESGSVADVDSIGHLPPDNSDRQHIAQWPSDHAVADAFAAETAGLASQKQLQDSPLEVSTTLAVSSSNGSTGLSRETLARWAVLVWIVGMVAFLLPLCCGGLFNRYLLRKAQIVQQPAFQSLLTELRDRLGLRRAIRLFDIDDEIVPITWGLFRPLILLPMSWRHWPGQRLRMVLLHELAHVKRFDLPLQLMARLSCAVYWFNPLIWYALRRLRIEREQACDDRVVHTGERASDYANELVAIAETHRLPRLALAVGMARSSRLEDRLRSLFDKARSHLPMNSRWGIGLLMSAAVVVTAIAVIRPVQKSVNAAEPKASLAEDSDASTSVQSVPGESDSTFTTATGRVLSPAGDPVNAAHVLVTRVTGSMYTGNEQIEILAETKTGRDGQFKLSYDAVLPNNQRGFLQGTTENVSVQIVTVHPNFSVGFHSNFNPQWDEQVEIEFKAPDALTGRLIDLEGRPLAGATLQVRAVAQASEPLDEWFKKAASNPRPDAEMMMMASAASRNERPRPVRFPSQTGFAANGIVPPVQSDQSGRFTIPNIGPDRMVVFEVAAPNVARTTVKMVTHDGPDVYDSYPDPRLRDRLIHGNDSTITVEPGFLVKGIVTEKGTGNPIPGCKIEVTQIAGSISSVEDFASTTTDASGAYRLDRLPADPPSSRGYRIRFSPPAEAPFFPTDLAVRLESDRHEKVFDVELPRARMVRGRVIDERTGKPVRSLVGYLPKLNNKIAAEFPNFRSGMRTVAFSDFRWTEPDGSFEVPAINGEGALCVTAQQKSAFGIAGNPDGIKGLQREGNRFVLYHLFGPSMINEFRKISLSDGDPDPEIEVALRSLSRNRLRIVDANGRPVVGCRVSGLLPDVMFAARQSPSQQIPLQSAEADIIGLEVESPRVLAIDKPGKELGAIAVVRKEDGSPVTVTLQSGGQIRGRLLDKAGDPIVGASVMATGISPVELPTTEFRNRPVSFRVYTSVFKTGRDGRFEIQGVIPGCAYATNFMGNGPLESLKSSEIESLRKQTSNVQPGESTDVGDIVAAVELTLQPLEVPDSALDETGRSDAIPTSVPATSEPADDVVTIKGQVVDPDGKPFPNAVVRAVNNLDFWKEKPAVVRTQSDNQGLFELKVHTSAFAPQSGGQVFAEYWKQLGVTAVASGYAPAFVPYVAIENNPSTTLKLVEDTVPITGRVVDLEGKPIAGITVKPSTVVATPQGDLNQWIEGVKQNDIVAQRAAHWPPLPLIGTGIPEEATTDADGRFTITGIGRERKVTLALEGSGIVRSTLTVATRHMDPLEWEAGGQFLSPGPIYGADFQYSAAPSRPIVGTVVDAKTRKPLPGVTIHSQTMSIGGRPVHGVRTLTTASDANGRYRLEGMPEGSENEILAVPGDGQPYFMRIIPVPNSTGLGPIPLDIKLHRGISIRGTITDKTTGKPITGAYLHYMPFLENEHAPNVVGDDDVMPAAFAYPDRYRSQADGSFHIVGVPGRAILGAMHPTNPYRQGVGSELIQGADEQGEFATYRSPNRPGKSWPHSMIELNAAEGTNSLETDLQLDPGESIEVTIVDPEGKPLAGCRVDGNSSQNMVSQELPSPTFTATNFGPNETRQIVITHEGRHLGRAVSVSLSQATNGKLIIELSPTANLTGRILDKNGDPVKGVTVQASTFSEGRFSQLTPVTTDSDGRYRFENVPSGCAYYVIAQRLFPVISTTELARSVAPDPGETKDLGDRVLGGNDA